MSTRTQGFGWFLSRGFGPQGWGTPAHRWGYRWTEPELYQQSARYLEQAGFDFVVIEDALSLGSPETIEFRIREAYGGPKHDPLALTPFILNATSRLRVIPTINPLSLPPYTAARHFTTLQHLSRGRFGINVVTDVGSSRHFGQAPIPHDEAYARLDEWLRGVSALNRSWGEGALVADERSGVFANAEHLDTEEYAGEHYRFQGPLNAVPYPDELFIVSPGGSPRGLEFAGKHAQVKLLMTQLSVDNVRSQRDRVRAATAAAGRDPDALKVYLVVKPVILGSDAEVERAVTASLDPTPEQIHAALLGLSSDLETDLLSLELDAPIDPGIFGDHVSRGTIDVLLGEHASFEEVTLRELILPRARLGRIADGTGQVGTAEDWADYLERIGTEADNDGVLVSGDFHPVTLHRTLDALVPLLRERGILRSA